MSISKHINPKTSAVGVLKHPLPGDVLARWKIAPGDVYLKTESGRSLRLKRAGDFLEESWKAKFVTSPNLLWTPAIDLKRVQELVQLYRAWAQALDPDEILQKRESFIVALRAGLRPEGGLSLLDLAFVCYTLFPVDASLIAEYQAKHVVLYRRGLLVSALAVLMAVALGYEEPTFLRDVYHTGWLLDLGLSSDEFSYWVALACQAEKHRPGAGDQLLKDRNASDQELRLFLEHPRFGFDRARTLVEKKFAFPELLTSILHHHEKSDGTGFPEGMTFSVLADWETLMVLADSMVDYREEMLEEDLRSSFGHLWSRYFANPVEGLPVQGIMLKIKAWFQVQKVPEAVA